jgi:hypothetical protein
MEHIHANDTDRLRTEFEQVKKPGAVPTELLTGSLEVVEDKALHGVKLHWLHGLVRKFSDSASCRLAAWRWLQPEKRPATQEHLVDLQRKVGLAHWEHREFCARLMDACKELLEKHPRLARHLEARLAEIEYRLCVPMAGDDDAARGFERLQAALLTAHAQQSATFARTVARNALTQVGAIAKHAIVGATSSACSFDANLMVPCLTNVGLIGRGARHAERLWGDFGQGVTDQYLVVVEEAPMDPENHRGFWIPDVRSRNRPLPGAPSALYFAAPQVVFTDDLPPLPLDDDALLGRWRDYFGGGRGGFNGTLFVSFPVIDHDHANAAAVVNVNIRDQRGPWHRALGHSWLGRANRLVAPWTVTAWHAYMTAWMYDQVDARTSFPTPRKLAAFVPMGDAIDSVRKLPEKLPENERGGDEHEPQK